MYLFFNQDFLTVGSPTLSFESKAFRYGELVFETMRLQNGQLLFAHEHYNRLINAANTIGLPLPKHFNQALLLQNISKLAEKNKMPTARVRVTLFGGNGGLFEKEPSAFNIAIETYPLHTEQYELNSNGLDLCIYHDIKKQNDVLSSFKNGNFMLYNMAAQYSKQQKCNEALILNTSDNVIESTISNIFIITNGIVHTPPLSDGCIAGIMRNYLLQHNPSIIEKTLTIDEVLSADEVFVTNVTRGIQWVKNIENKNYNCQQTMAIWAKAIAPLNK